MKKLLAILLALTLALTLLPTAAFAESEDDTSLGTTWGLCVKCKEITTFKILAYIRTPIASKPDPLCHWARAKCTECGEIAEFVPDGDSAYHTGGDDSAVTCTTGKICEKCGDEYGKLGHDWGEWQSNGDNKTHTRHCQREGCNEVDTASCGGDSTATCVTLGTCTDCGQQYYGGHNFAKYRDSDADTHWYPCLNENCKARKDEADHLLFVQGNMHLKSAATCISNAVYYTNCASCYYKGTDTYVYQWGQLDPTNHDGGTELKNAKAATCTEKGYTGDTHCKGCGVKLSDGTDIPSAGHNLKHVDAKRATTRAEGNIEYWYCDSCGKYFKDEAAAKEITQADTVIAKKHRTNSDSTDSTGSTADKTVKSSKTGDPGVMLYVGLAAMSLTGGAWLRRKKH